MKKVRFCWMIFVLLFLLEAGVLNATGDERPVVVILKTPKHELVAETFRMNWGRTLSQGVNKTRKIDYFRAEWSKESEKEIEALVRDAVEIAGGWPVKPGDVVLIKPNLVASIFFLLSFIYD